MLRFLLRALGLAALAGAFAAAVMDGARSIANGAVALSPTGTALARLSPAKFAAFSSRFHTLSRRGLDDFDLRIAGVDLLLEPLA